MADYPGVDITGYGGTVDNTDALPVRSRPAGPGVATDPADFYALATVSHTDRTLNNYTGLQLYNFDLWWLHKVHVLWTPVIINAASGVPEATIFLWNTFSGRKTLDTLTVEGDDTGVTTDFPVGNTVPSLFMQSMKITVDANEGPASFDILYTYSWVGGGQSILQVTGLRVALWDFDLNWEDQYVEQPVWTTDVIVARNGKEQRRSLTWKSRSNFALPFKAKGARAKKLRDFVYKGMASKYLVALPHSVTLISNPVLAGAEIVPYDYEGTQVKAKSYLVARPPSGEPQIMQVKSLLPDGFVELQSGLLADLPNGTRITPASLAIMETPTAITAVTDQLVTGIAMFVQDDSDVAASYYSPDPGDVMVNGRPVLDFRHNWQVGRADQLSRPLREEKYAGWGVRDVHDFGNSTVYASTISITAKGASEISRLRGFMAWARGRARSFWVRSEFDDIPITKDLVSSDSFLQVTGLHVVDALAKSDNRPLLFIHTMGGEYIYLETTGSSTQISTNVYNIDLTAVLGFDMPLSEVNRCGWVYHSRFDQDAQTLEYITDDLVIMQTTILSVEQ